MKYKSEMINSFFRCHREIFNELITDSKKNYSIFIYGYGFNDQHFNTVFEDTQKDVLVLTRTIFCFANSSKRLHSWFLKTDLYKKYVSACLNGEGMHKSAKRKVMLTLTILMGIGFFFMAVKGIWIPCLILILVWIGHLYYFMYRIKTKIDETDLL